MLISYKYKEQILKQCNVIDLQKTRVMSPKSKLRNRKQVQNETVLLKPYKSGMR